MDYILGLTNENRFDGFYIEGIHTVFPTRSIAIDNELYNYLLNEMSIFGLAAEIEYRLYTIADKDKFENIIIEWNF